MKSIDILRGMLVEEEDCIKGLGKVRIAGVKGEGFVCSGCLFGASCRDARDCKWSGACMGHMRPDGRSVYFARARRTYMG